MTKLILSCLIESRFRFLTIIFFTTIALSFTVRMVLLSYSAETVDFTITNLAGIILIGFFYDTINAFYLYIPIALLLTILPERIIRKPWHTR